MSVTRWNFPNGSDGDVLTAPLGGADTISLTGGTATLEDAHPLSPGGLGARFVSDGAAAGVAWIAKEGLSSTAYGVDIYVYFPTGGTGIGATTYFIWAGSGSSARSMGVRISPTRTIQVNTSNVAAAWTSTAMPLDTLIRISVYVTTSTTVGTVRAAWYLGSSTTPEQDSGTLTGLNTQVSIDRIRVGSKASTLTAVTEMWLASWAYDPEATGLIAPFAEEELEVDAGADRATEVNEGIAISPTVSGGATPYAYEWTVESGSGTFDDATEADVVFTPTAAGSHTLRLTVTDTEPTSVFDELVVTAYGELDFAAAAGWTSIGGGAANRLAAISDADAGTYVQTADDPTAEVITLTAPAVQPPVGDFVVHLSLSTTFGTATITPRLYQPDGSTLVSTADPITATTSPVEYTVTFPAADIVAAALDPEDDWGTGMVVTATAAV